MEPQSTINLLVGFGEAILGWAFREVWIAVKELTNDLSSLREGIAKDYVTKSELGGILNRMDAKLDKIFDKLDEKADK